MQVQHIAIIMDGNRRFAKRLMLEPWKGHEYGAKKLQEVLEWCKEFKIKIVTLYTLSIQNLFSRPKNELEFILNEFREQFKKILDNNNSVHKEKVKINIIGRIELLPKDLQNLFLKIMEKTKNYSNYILNFAIAYGGQEEITDAVKKVSEDVKSGKIEIKDINEEIVRNALYTGNLPYPDIIIRTGGEKRISNFLLWQSAYSELFFLDKMWPEITKEDFIQVLKEFEKRERRFGR
ncbi:MAG: polyprenyl diphosphate synthase [Candidatus Aenigmatarchaeota archaeon]